MRSEQIIKGTYCLGDISYFCRPSADVAKLVDALSSGGSVFGHGGSSPLIRTKPGSKAFWTGFFFFHPTVAYLFRTVAKLAPGMKEQHPVQEVCDTSLRPFNIESVENGRP